MGNGCKWNNTRARSSPILEKMPLRHFHRHGYRDSMLKYIFLLSWLSNARFSSPAVVFLLPRSLQKKKKPLVYFFLNVQSWWWQFEFRTYRWRWQKIIFDRIAAWKIARYSLQPRFPGQTTYDLLQTLLDGFTRFTQSSDESTSLAPACHVQQARLLTIRLISHIKQ